MLSVSLQIRRVVYGPDFLHLPSPWALVMTINPPQLLPPLGYPLLALSPKGEGFVTSWHDLLTNLYSLVQNIHSWADNEQL